MLRWELPLNITHLRISYRLIWGLISHNKKYKPKHSFAVYVATLAIVQSKAEIIRMNLPIVNLQCILYFSIKTVNKEFYVHITAYFCPQKRFFIYHTLTTYTLYYNKLFILLNLHYQNYLRTVQKARCISTQVKEIANTKNLVENFLPSILKSISSSSMRIDKSATFYQQKTSPKVCRDIFFISTSRIG